MTESLQAQTGRNYDSEALLADDVAHHLHPFTDHKALAEEGGGRVITHAEGIYLWDAEGKRYLDGMAGLWCVNAGYGRKELVAAAASQMTELPFYNTFFKTTNAPAAELSKMLSDLMPDNFNHVFYANSGSEANDTNLRMVRHFWVLEGKPEKQIIISRQNAYHGSTIAALSLGGMAAMHGQGGAVVPGIEHVRQPYWYAEGGDMDEDEFGLVCARAVEEKILEVGADKVAAFIGEPVQGAGGVIIPPKTYWPEINRICKKYDILLICDEVICGFGRTGNWFGHETLGIEADMITMAKGMSSGYLPISGVMVGDRVARSLIDKGGEFYHGFTYSGHPTSCAVALANLKIIRDEGLVEKVQNETGPYLAKALKTLEDHPLVGQTRSLGLMGAIELVEDKAMRRQFEEGGKVGTICRDHCINNGVIMRAVRDIMVMSPPLTITPAQIDEMVALARKAIDATAKDIGVK